MKSIIISIINSILTISIIIAQPISWESKGIGGGGALFSPSISHHNPSEIFMPCDMTEMFHTTDFGKSWEMLPFTELISHIESKVQYTDDSSILYAIHNKFDTDTKIPKKSTDGGQTWNNIYDPTLGESYYLFADPRSTERILLSSYDQLYFSNNGGASFSLVYTGNDLYLGGVFWDEGNIYVGTADGLLVSNDNGDSFTIQNYSGFPPNSGFLSLTGAKSGSNTYLFGVVRSTGSMWPTMQPSEYWGEQEIYKLSMVESPTWSVASDGIPEGSFPFFVDMARNNSSVVYAAGSTEWPNNPAVYKSSDGGNSWVSVYETSNNSNISTGWMGDGGDLNWGWAENAMGFDVCDTNADILIVTDWGFPHVSDDGGNHWEQAYVQEEGQNIVGSSTPQNQNYQGNGLENTSSWWIHWTSENNMLAAYTDITALRSNDGGDTWSFDYEGNEWNSTYHIVEAMDGTLYAAVSSVHDIYQSTYLHDSNINNGGGAILKSIDSGANWTMLYDFNNPVVWLALNSSSNDVLYAAVANSDNGGIYMTTNLQSPNLAFNPTVAPPRTEGHPYNIHVLDDGTLLASYSGRRDASWAFTPSSGVFTSTDNGNTWMDISDVGMHYWTKDVIVDPHDNAQNTWYVAVHSGWGGPPNNLGGLYKTTDRGQTWERILDLDRVESASIHPSNPNIMYVTTEYEGLWYTENLNMTSNADFNLLEDYPFQHPTRLFFNPYDENEVWLTSFGHGMSKGSVIPTSILNPSEEERSLIDVYPNPTNGMVNIETEMDSYHIVISNILGEQLIYVMNERTINIENLPKGIYLVSMYQDQKIIGVEKLVKE